MRVFSKTFSSFYRSYVSLLHGLDGFPFVLGYPCEGFTSEKVLPYIFLLRGRKTGKRRPNYAAVFLFLKQFPCKVGNTDSGVIQLRSTVLKSIAVIPLHPLEELVLVALKLCKDLARSLAEQQERNILLYDRSVFSTICS